MTIRFPINGDPDRWYECCEEEEQIIRDDDDAYETAMALEMEAEG